MIASLMVISLAESPNAWASHFRYRDLSWERVAGNEVEFRLRIADRRSFYGIPGPNVGDAWSDFVDFGDGTTGQLQGSVVAVNPVDDWFIAEVTGRHAYQSAGPFTVEWESCCTLSTLRNSPDSSLRSRAVVDLSNGNNASPVTSVSPIVNVASGGNRTFRVPALDADGDSLTYRLATSSESLVTQPADLSIDARTGVMTWNTVGKAQGLWITTVVVSDGLAETQITFLLNLGASGGEAPVWTAPTPPDRKIFDVRRGATVEFTVRASDPEGLPVTITSLGLPSDMTCTGLATPAVDAQVSCSFTPTSSGFHLVTFDAQDPAGTSAGPRNYSVGSSRYVSLGDSFASGEGVPPYDEGTATDEGGGTPENECHRSPGAWPRIVGSSGSNRVPSTHRHAACSGARTINMGVPGHEVETQYDEALQLSWLGADVSLVTVMVGGNDVLFADVLADCNVSGLGIGANRCSGRWDDEVSARIDALAGINDDFPDVTPLEDLYRDIRRQAPGARVLAVGYPELFKRGGTPVFPCAGLNTLDQRWVNEKTKQLNDVIAEAAGEAGVRYVDVEDAFDGHHLCESFGRDEWVNDRDVSDLEHSYHPNDLGHQKLAEIVLDYVEDEFGSPTRLRVFPFQTVTTTSVVSAGLQSLTFSTQWPGSDVEMTLRAPSGRVIGRTAAAADVEHVLGPTYELYEIHNPEPGTWTVELYGADVATDGEDVDLSVFQVAPRNQAPDAAVTDTIDGTTVTVDGSSSTDSDGSILRYEWDFGDGATAEGPQATHTYTASGEYMVGLIVTDDDGDAGFAHTSVIKVGGFVFEGFRTPVDNPPVLNSMNAGRTVPLKWRLSNQDGSPVDDPASFARLSVVPIACPGGTPISEVEETGTSTSGLLYKGDGEWQYNWGTPSSYAGTCRRITVVLSDGTTAGRTADFQFR